MALVSPNPTTPIPAGLVPPAQASVSGNPYLDELQGLSEGAKNALKMAGHPVPPAPSAPQPGMLLDHSDGPAPPVPTSSPVLVTGPKKGQATLSSGAQPSRLQLDTAERGRLLDTGSGISQIAHRIEGSRLGEAHPFFGKLLGDVAQGAATVGDIGLSAVAPQIAVRVPGTEYHHQELLNQANKAVAQDEAQRTAEASQAQREAEAAGENASSEHTQAETAQVVPNAESTRNLQGAEAGHAEAETSALENPVAGTPELATYRSLVKMGMSPSDALSEIERDKQMALRPPTMGAITLQLPNGSKVAGKKDSQGNLLLADNTPAPKGSLIYQQPNYGELVLPTKTQTVLVDGVPTIMGWNERTHQYDIPQGQSASGAFGHEEAQAGAVTRAGDDLIESIEANKKLMGNPEAIIRSAVLGTPWADPATAGLRAQISTFAALQPSMHGFRGTDALRQFEKILGGIPNNPDALIASIRGIERTAGAVNPGLEKSFSLKRAMSLPFNKGKTEQEVRSDLESHGYKVTQ